MADLGTDISCVDDLDPNLTVVSERTALAQAAIRRITTPGGGLFYDATYGFDVRGLLNRGLIFDGPNSRLVESEILQDERITDIEADVSFDATAETLTINLRITDEQAETFDLTLLVDQLTTTILDA